MRTSKPITVTFGKQQASVDAQLASGACESASEIVRTALRALDSEGCVERRIREALDDSRPSVSMDEVFYRIEQTCGANENHESMKYRVELEPHAEADVSDIYEVHS